MANGSNKTGLLNFLAREWSENAIYAEKIKEHTLFVTHGDNCTKLSSSDGLTYMYHLKRANYHAFLWKHALETQTNQAPDGHGWQMEEGQLEI